MNRFIKNRNQVLIGTVGLLAGYLGGKITHKKQEKPWGTIEPVFGGRHEGGLSKVILTINHRIHADCYGTSHVNCRRNYPVVIELPTDFVKSNLRSHAFYDEYPDDN